MCVCIMVCACECSCLRKSEEVLTGHLIPYICSYRHPIWVLGTWLGSSGKVLNHWSISLAIWQFLYTPLDHSCKRKNTLSTNTLKYLFLIKCVNVYVCIWVCTHECRCLPRPEALVPVSLGYRWLWGTQCGCWVLNSGTLEEPQVLSMAELTL